MSSIENAVKVLKEGGIVVIPTDTVYGLAASPSVPGAEERIYEVKGRERGKPLPLLVSDLQGALAFGAQVGDTEVRLAEKFWPGPLTLIMSVGDGKEGFRVPDHDVAIEVIRRTGGALRVTSANLSGEDPALTAEDAKRELGGKVDVYIDAGRTPGGQASTVAEVTCIDGRLKVNVLREGPISKASLEEIAYE